MPDPAVERTTLLLVHLGGDLYGVNLPWPVAHTPDGDRQPPDSFRFVDIAESLGGLGWEVENDVDEGAHRTLFLKRES